MDFDLTEDQKLLADTVDTFVAKSSPISRFRKLRDDAIGWEPKVWKEMGELGWLSVPFPEAVGGFGGSFVDVALILERFGRTLVPEPYLSSVVLAGMAIDQAGSAEQGQRFLAPLIAGDATLAFAHGEGDGRLAKGVGTTAERDGGAWTIRGQKTFVLDGHDADQVVVTAQTPDGLGLFVVDRDAKSAKTEVVKTIDGRKAARLTFEGLAVDDDRRLGDPGPSSEAVVERVRDYGAAAACAEGVGITKEVLRMTVEYLHTRKQFDVPIGSFQVLQHYAVDVFVETQLLESLSLAASVKVQSDDDDERREIVSAAKAQLTASGRFVVQKCIQLFGGIGVTDEHDVGLYFKRMHALNALFGDADTQLRRFAALPGFAP